MKNLIRYIINVLSSRRVFLKHLFFSFLTLFLLFFVWYKSLDLYTKKGHFVQVPQFENVYYTDIDEMVKAHDLRYEITDTVYDRDLNWGVIVSQHPPANTDVKEGRKILLKINSLNPRKVQFPDIIDLSRKQAIDKLKKAGFRVGKLIYKADIAKGRVLGAKIRGQVEEIYINPDSLPKLYDGTVVNLIIGEGLHADKFPIPNLIGLLREEADTELKVKGFNIGIEYFNNGEYLSDIKDSEDHNLDSLVVYNQLPSSGSMINMGATVDLYFSYSLKDSLQ